MKKQHITLAEVKENARKAYDAGNLLAQQPKFVQFVHYFYRKGDVGCAIGVSLNSATAASIREYGDDNAVISTALNGNQAIGSSIDRFISWDENEGQELADIQRIHDDWAGNKKLERDFLKAIDHPAAQD